MRLDNAKQELKGGLKDDMAKIQFPQAFCKQPTSQAMLFVITKKAVELQIKLFE